MRPVVFDFDGVLVDSERYNEMAFAEYVTELGRADAAHLFSTTLGRRDIDCMPEIARHLDRSPEDVQRGIGAREASYSDAIARRPGALELLDALRREGRTLALATSSAEHVVSPLLSRLGLGESFDVIVTAADVEKGKPDPAIYLAAAGRLGRDPLDCIAVEDAPAGVEAARAAGMYCIGLTGSVARSELRQANAVADDLWKVLEEVRRLGGRPP